MRVFGNLIYTELTDCLRFFRASKLLVRMSIPPPPSCPPREAAAAAAASAAALTAAQPA